MEKTRQSQLIAFLHWSLRIAVAMEFIGHGAFGILGKEQWVPYITVFGFSPEIAWQLMLVVGGVDVVIGAYTLFAPRRFIFAYMAFWGLFTAMLRPLTGESFFELIERSYNFGVPLLFLLLHGFGTDRRSWLEVVKAPPAIDHRTIQRLNLALRGIVGLMLIGHGGLGFFVQKAGLQKFYASAHFDVLSGVPVSRITSAIGLFEMSLGIVVAFFPIASLLFGIAVWKVATESLFIVAGAYGAVFEVIERGSAYFAPLMLVAVIWTAKKSSAHYKGENMKLVNAVITGLILLVSLQSAATTSPTPENGRKEVAALEASSKDLVAALGKVRRPDMWSRRFVFVALHDIYNSIIPTFRTYGEFSFQTQNDPKTVAKAAIYVAYLKYFERDVARSLPFATADQQTAVDAELLKLTQTIQQFLASYPADTLAEATQIAETVISQYFLVLRANDIGDKSYWQTSSTPGQFRIEPNANQEGQLTFVSYAFARPFAMCDVQKVLSPFRRTVPAFDAAYLKEVEEVRCLARALGADGAIQPSVGCIEQQTVDTLDTMQLGFASARGPVVEHLKKSRNYDFVDDLRFRALNSIAYIDADVAAGTLRYEVNHWRPISAIRNGLGGTIATTVEPDWMPMEGFANNFPDYPSGSTAQTSSYSRAIEKILDEDPRHSNQGGNIQTIDGQPFELIQKTEYTYLGASRKVEKKIGHLQEIIEMWGTSRVLTGSHFRFSVVDGKKLGERVVDQIWAQGIFAKIGSARDIGGSHLKADGTNRVCY